MAKNHRLAQAHGAETAMVEIMQVRAADAAEADPHPNVVGAERRARATSSTLMSLAAWATTARMISSFRFCAHREVRAPSSVGAVIGVR